MEEQTHLAALQIHQGIVEYMLSGWHAICQSRLGECYQRLIFLLHFGNVLWFEQSVDIKKPGGILSYPLLTSMIWVVNKNYTEQLYICGMLLHRYFYRINAVSNHFQPWNAEVLTTSVRSAFGIKKQKTVGVPGTFAEIFPLLSV